MTEVPSSTANCENIGPVQWKVSTRRRRKSGYSNIFTGVNLHQLHRLFRTAGDREAEARAKLVWRGMDTDVEGAEEEEQKEGEGEERQEEATLVRALVGLRLRGRNKAGIRAEGNRDQNWVRASGYLRVEEPLSVYTNERAEDDKLSCTEELLPATEEDKPENQKPFKPSTWRLNLAREDCARQTERYLHHILH